jgi:hypothetical protein
MGGQVENYFHGTIDKTNSPALQEQQAALGMHGFIASIALSPAFPFPRKE